MISESSEQTHPVVNLEETIGKTVGRQKPKQGLSLSDSQERSIQWRRQFGGVKVPRGVFRFNSHEEADQWMIRKLAQAAAKKS
ncbi:MAG: hypothetical protein ACI8UO_000394 [Verrucomicrobiales bacterium]